MFSHSATFLFNDRQRFDARCDHDLLRSSLPVDLDVPPTADLWKRSPIDFTPKNFHPTRKKLPRALSTTDLSGSRETREQTSHSLDTSVMQPFAMPYENTKGLNQHSPTDDDGFVLDTRVNYDPVQRMLNTDQYRNPRLHDYRQYPDIKELELPEFLSTQEQDPYNLRFLSDHLNTLSLEKPRDTIDRSLPAMYRPLTVKPTWESRLILPKLPYPNKYAAYTRHRNPTRTVHSAYWERVETYVDQQRSSNQFAPRLNAQ